MRGIARCLRQPQVQSVLRLRKGRPDVEPETAQPRRADRDEQRRLGLASLPKVREAAFDEICARHQAFHVSIIGPRPLPLDNLQEHPYSLVDNRQEVRLSAFSILPSGIFGIWHSAFGIGQAEDGWRRNQTCFRARWIS